MGQSLIHGSKNVEAVEEIGGTQKVKKKKVKNFGFLSSYYKAVSLKVLYLPFHSTNIHNQLRLEKKNEVERNIILQRKSLLFFSFYVS